MRYLFFDIEGANCYKFVAKMCTFGYVLTDEKFKVKSKIDVIMNPEAPFDRHIISQKMNAYPIERYLSRPPFYYFYKSLKNLIENKDQLVVGWSIDNDVKYIYDACKRYNLQQINYSYLDIQKVVMEIEDLKSQPSLESICEKYNIKFNVLHKSDDDAFITFKITKHICNKLELSLQELFLKYKHHVSDVETFKSHLKSDEEIEMIINRRKISYAIRSGKSKNKNTNKHIKKEDTFGFSIDIIDSNPEEVYDLIKYIYSCGAKCSNSLKECNKIICTKENKAHYKEIGKHSESKVMTLKQFKDKLDKENAILNK